MGFSSKEINEQLQILRFNMVHKKNMVEALYDYNSVYLPTDKELINVRRPSLIKYNDLSGVKDFSGTIADFYKAPFVQDLVFLINRQQMLYRLGLSVRGEIVNDIEEAELFNSYQAYKRYDSVLLVEHEIPFLQVILPKTVFYSLCNLCERGKKCGDYYKILEFMLDKYDGYIKEYKKAEKAVEKND